MLSFIGNWYHPKGIARESKRLPNIFNQSLTSASIQALRETNVACTKCSMIRSEKSAPIWQSGSTRPAAR